MKRVPPAVLDASRKAAIEEAREAGRRGTPRVPDSALFGCGDPSDSLILKLVDAHALGVIERQKDNKP